MLFGKKTPLMALILLAVAIGTVVTTAAQINTSPGDYPTLTALQAAVVPPRNQVSLAQRLLGVGTIPPPPTSASTRQVGDQETFTALNSDTNDVFAFPATLRVVGQHIYLWVENGQQVDNGTLQELANAFDDHIYDNVRALWGDEASPGIDGDPHIYGVFAANLGINVGAYFYSDSSFPRQVVPTSNEHEMFYFNLDGISLNNLYSLESVVAHEFQHMIRSNHQINDDTWVNEGLSEFTQLFLYGDNAEDATYFLEAPNTQLNNWAEDSYNRIQNYGAALMFMTYLHDRYGDSAMHAFSADPSPVGLNAVDDVLGALGQPGVNEFFADWVLANYFQNLTLDDGRYGYKLLKNLNFPILPVDTAYSYSHHWQSTLNQYSTDYIGLNSLQSQRTLTLKFDAPDTVQLIPTKAYSGEHMWYSNRHDYSDTTLTHAFDLTGVSSARLTYRAWYYTEDGWDYGYVMVSTDNGATWQPLTTPHMAPRSELSYGSGYTGQSGGWIKESIPLDAYAGQNILLRFEMITDDTVTQPGLAIDDVAIPELGYFNDFEENDGGWQSQGWIRMDNVLPQEVWVQVAQQVGNQLVLDRQRVSGAQTWTVALDSHATQAVIAISPFAPLTSVPVNYTLDIAGQ